MSKVCRTRTTPSVRCSPCCPERGGNGGAASSERRRRNGARSAATDGARGTCARVKRVSALGPARVYVYVRAWAGAALPRVRVPRYGFRGLHGRRHIERASGDVFRSGLRARATHRSGRGYSWRGEVWRDPKFHWSFGYSLVRFGGAPDRLPWCAGRWLPSACGDSPGKRDYVL